MNYRIFPPLDLPEATIALPLSKSVSNRALIINAFTPGATPLTEVAHCSDTQAMTTALASETDDINVGGAGTAMRFLTAYFASQPGRTVTLDGDERMRQRPIAPLVTALRLCGAKIDYMGAEGFPPLRIHGTTLSGGSLNIDASISSQFISALLMAAPLMSDGLHLTLDGDISSAPYIDLTLHLMRMAGVDAERERNEITVAHGQYSPASLPAEADWSAASYWYEIEALTSGFISLRGLDQESRQPDRAVSRIYESLGVVTDTEGEEPGCIDLMASPDLSPRLIIDLSDTPDLTQTIAVTCAMAGIPFRLTGLASLKIKETDRLAALQTELLKVGVSVNITGDHTMEWDGRRLPIASLPEFDTYGDHRMALALAPVAIYIPGIVIRDAEVVGKSYPEYWKHLSEAGFKIIDGDIPLEQLRAAGDTEDEEDNDR